MTQLVEDLLVLARSDTGVVEMPLAVEAAKALAAAGAKHIYLAGNDEQKKKWMPKLTSGEYAAGSFALSEPEARGELATLAADLYHAAQEKRIPFAPVSTLADLVNSKHLKARGFFVEVTHPEAGKLTQAGAPYKLSKTPWEIRLPAPALGQHNDEVFREKLGLSPDEVKGAA